MSTNPRAVSGGEHDEPPWLIILAASSDGIRTIGNIVAALPKDLPAAVVVLQHRSGAVQDLLPDILRLRAVMPIEYIGHGQRVEAGRIYVGRPDLHLEIDRHRRFRYVDGTRKQGSLSSANPLLASAAETFQSRLIAVVLTGRGADAADGVDYVRAWGGLVIAQDPATATFPEMPAAAIATGSVNVVLGVDEIARRLIAVVRNGGAAREAVAVPALHP